jgi:hypothetical protein
MNRASQVLDTASGQLAELPDRESDGQRIWAPEELGAILQHQMSTPLRVDLIGMERAIAARVKNLATAQGLLLKSLGDLLHHPNPPIELLKLTKDFAKACRLSPESSLPGEVATVLYFACILVARTRCRQKISALSDEQLQEGIAWVLESPWLDKATRKLFEAGKRRLRALEGGAR